MMIPIAQEQRLEGRGRNGGFDVRQVTCWDIDNSDYHKVYIEFYSRSSGNQAPMYLAGPVREVRRLLKQLIDALPDDKLTSALEDRFAV